MLKFTTPLEQQDTAIVVTSFERPDSLRRSLLSLAAQSEHHRIAEIVVADDGSRDHTWTIVDAFARNYRLTTAFTTHGHQGFQPGRSRNEAVWVSTAPYLIFIDGDCVMPPNFLAIHLTRRQHNVVLCGESARLDPQISQQLTGDAICNWSRDPQLTEAEHRYLQKKAIRDRLYSLFPMKMKPHLTANHFSLWRLDFERVNGFDLSYFGWGLEDTDLQRRLGAAGLRFRSILTETRGYHLWHPPVPTFVRKASGTPNERYYRSRRPGSATTQSGLRQIDRAQFVCWRWTNGALIDHPQLPRAVRRLA